MDRLSLIAVSTLIGAAIGASVVYGSPTTAAVPACIYEDGNPDGLPCIWVDPDTGAQYYNDGSNYYRGAAGDWETDQDGNA
ncbi:hypothetical protein [Mycolicibacterium phlei]|uniref:hypothetical protein n=1 Tax=Mycolicibacterium phlei TaxID=1771 RepID=UPI0002FD6E7A|nr:hypothetical protein [Mycolicibacterium phlei]